MTEIHCILFFLIKNNLNFYKEIPFGIQKWHTRKRLNELFSADDIHNAYKNQEFFINKEQLESDLALTPLEFSQKYDWLNWDNPIGTGLMLGYSIHTTVGILRRRKKRG